MRNARPRALTTTKHSGQAKTPKTEPFTLFGSSERRGKIRTWTQQVGSRAPCALTCCGGAQGPGPLSQRHVEDSAATVTGNELSANARALLLRWGERNAAGLAGSLMDGSHR